jgi:hypothetical protein
MQVNEQIQMPVDKIENIFVALGRVIKRLEHTFSQKLTDCVFVAIDKYSAKEFDNEKTRESSASDASSVIGCPPKPEQQKQLSTMPDDRSRASSVSSTVNFIDLMEHRARISNVY